tara:strand:+ start:3954 stop:4445 length:492 start_codon:yes stop_codon:yes gene_type:complete
MLLELKNKHTLTIDDFKFKCSVGKMGTRKSKCEGDLYTPKGKFTFGNVYYRSDRVKKPDTNLKIFKISKNMGWCDDPEDKSYNKLIKIPAKKKFEKMFRIDCIYDLLVVINYNTKSIKPFKGSAIFLHLTSNYKETKGCVAVKKNDLYIILKLLNKNSKIKIF